MLLAARFERSAAGILLAARFWFIYYMRNPDESMKGKVLRARVPEKE